MDTASSTTSTTPWHAAYPAPQAEPIIINFVLVDLRRNGHEGGTIRGSINLPAQTLYPTIPTLYALFKDAGVHKVIWYCGSSKGRGTCAAGWFAEHIASEKDEEMKSLALSEGIKGWALAGKE
ncbi:hypothetical protein EK21DRAFT_101874 [Setomelanomma holmii]|uniref:Rhodanese domain-containing protein n=1 Tax=Setomelanomma holmii TaxID=210430 RepID=A0A9P4H7B4_9PLEO|nr:hypothetical protein EK21DRAFT_101874 [Setomelanomma holmii]